MLLDKSMACLYFLFLTTSISTSYLPNKTNEGKYFLFTLDNAFKLLFIYAMKSSFWLTIETLMVDTPAHFRPLRTSPTYPRVENCV